MQTPPEVPSRFVFVRFAEEADILRLILLLGHIHLHPISRFPEPNAAVEPINWAILEYGTSQVAQQVSNLVQKISPTLIFKALNNIQQLKDVGYVNLGPCYLFQ
jgi:hypothetical protein